MNAQPKAPSTEHSLWLLPAEPLKGKLRSIIQRLATAHDAVDFEPHVTLAFGPSNDDEAIAIAHEIAGRFSPIELTALQLDHSRLYTKTLFIQFAESKTAQNISDTVKNRSAKASNYVLNPHLSLLYKTMPVAAQAELCRTLDVPEGSYLFDRLRVIETEVPLAQPQQIKRWRTVFECSLGFRG